MSWVCKITINWMTDQWLITQLMSWFDEELVLLSIDMIFVWNLFLVDLIPFWFCSVDYVIMNCVHLQG